FGAGAQHEDYGHRGLHARARVVLRDAGHGSVDGGRDRSGGGGRGTGGHATVDGVRDRSGGGVRDRVGHATGGVVDAVRGARQEPVAATLALGILVGVLGAFRLVLLRFVLFFELLIVGLGLVGYPLVRDGDLGQVSGGIGVLH